MSRQTDIEDPTGAHIQLRRDAQVELIASLRILSGPSECRGRRQDAGFMELLVADQRPVNDLVEEFVLGRLQLDE
jgi:hypothetical protein